jgi:hypothetical protein
MMKSSMMLTREWFLVTLKVFIGQSPPDCNKQHHILKVKATAFVLETSAAVLI